MPFPNLKTGFTVRNRGRAAFSALWLAGKQVPANILFTIAQGATAGICNVTLQIGDKYGNPIANSDLSRNSFLVYLSDNAAGQGITALAPGTGIAAGANGAILYAPLASKAVQVVADQNGTFQLAITDAAKTFLVYVCYVNPITGNVFASRKLVAGDYK